MRSRKRCSGDVFGSSSSASCTGCMPSAAVRRTSTAEGFLLFNTADDDSKDSKGCVRVGTQFCALVGVVFLKHCVPAGTQSVCTFAATAGPSNCAPVGTQSLGGICVAFGIELRSF